MDWLLYALLGLIQGITEWLPISSSGHLVMIEEFFGVKSPGLAFEVLLNFATFLAMIFVFRKELVRLVIGFFGYIFSKDPASKQAFYDEFNFGMLLIVGTIPAGIFGFLLEDYVETHLKSLTSVAISLVVTGIGLYVIATIKGHRKQLTFKDAIWIGLFQVIALIPGISRSGATIFASIYRRLDKELAVRYSFFLAIPISIGTMVFKLNDLLDQMTLDMVSYYFIAFIVSFVSAIFAIKWFIGILNQGKLIYFTYYCISIGMAVLVYQYFA